MVLKQQILPKENNVTYTQLPLMKKRANNKFAVKIKGNENT